MTCMEVVIHSYLFGVIASSAPRAESESSVALGGADAHWRHRHRSHIPGDEVFPVLETDLVRSHHSTGTACISVAPECPSEPSVFVEQRH